MHRSEPSSSTAPRSTLLDLRDVSTSYEEDGVVLQALEHVNLTVHDGEFIALIGPSGCGKSTLLDIVTGLYPETSGDVILDGQPMPFPQRPGHAAYMRQKDLLMPWRTALENAALALEVHGVSKREALDHARERFATFGLAGFEDRYPAQLSGGMRQRVAFLRTVLSERRLLLLDEPFGALDAMNRASLQTWLTELWEREQQGVILVTHDVDEAIFLADRVVAMSPRPGRIIHEEVILLPRHRTRDMITTDVFNAHRAVLLEKLGLLNPEGAIR